jgi:hypothetical protein
LVFKKIAIFATFTSTLRLLLSPVPQGKKEKKKRCWGGFGEVSNTRQHW